MADRRAEDVLRAYRDLYVGREDDRLSLYLALTTDPYPDGEQVIVLYGLYVGPPDEAEAALAPIRSLGQPVFDGLRDDVVLRPADRAWRRRSCTACS